MSKKKFTDRSIQAIKPQGKRFEAWEDNGKGCGLRILPTGRKSSIYLYRFNGKVRRMTFVGYPDLPLADAHLKHAESRKLLKKGSTLVRPTKPQRQRHEAPLPLTI